MNKWYLSMVFTNFAYPITPPTATRGDRNTNTLPKPASRTFGGRPLL